MLNFLKFRRAPFPLLVAAVSLVACTTARPHYDTSESGWKIRSGQAVWRSYRRAQEVAGELTIATHTDGRTLVEFSREAKSLVSAQTSPGRWWIEFSGDSFLAGHGSPPSRFVWLHLARFMDGSRPPARWSFERKSDGGWRLENRAQGEVIEGILTRESSGAAAASASARP